MTAGYEIYAMSKARGDYPACTCDELIPWDADRITVSGIDFDLFWLPGHAVEQVGFVNLGVNERPNLIVLNSTQMPAVLVEVGFINTDADNALLDAKFGETAQAIADGVLQTLWS